MVKRNTYVKYLVVWVPLFPTGDHFKKHRERWLDETKSGINYLKMLIEIPDGELVMILEGLYEKYPLLVIKDYLDSPLDFNLYDRPM